MGNNLCAPLWKKPYRDGDYPWYPKKDSHLLRLWAEVFRVIAAEGELAWERVSEDVVPINITCIQAEPETVFQVTAYSRHVEKIFDTRLIQPGTKINQSSECFVHWRDHDHNCEWGLNFTTTIDARRFIDCCETQAHRLSARKATSSTSLRLSPPKKSRGGNKKAISAPSSPTGNKPRRTVSSPDDLASQGHDFRSHHSSLRGFDPRQPASQMVDSLATMPRMRQGNGTQPYFHGDQRPRPTSSVSRDNLSMTLPRKQIHSENMDQLKQQLKQFPSRQNSDPVRAMMTSNRQNSDPGQQYKINIPSYPALDALPRKSILKNRQDSSSNSSSCLDRHDMHIWKPQDPIAMAIRSRTPNPSMYHTNLNIEPKSQPPPPPRSASALGERGQPSREQPLRSQSVCERKLLETSINGENGTTTTVTSLSSHNICSNDNNNSSLRDDQSTRVSEISTLSTLSTVSQSTVKENSPHRQQSQDQGSPDWPPPPEPLSPCSPEVPQCDANFDSDTLKRMLQSLPLPGEAVEYRDYDDLELHMGSPVTQSQPVSPVSAPSPSYPDKDELPTLQRTQSLGRRGSRNLEMNMLDELDAMLDARNARNKGGKRKDYKTYGRDSYPDSGVSGMTADTVDSSKAATLPAGFSRRGMDPSAASPTRKDNEDGSATLPRSSLRMSEMSANEDSDDEDSDSSSIHTLPSESQSALSRRTGAVRKAGWLIVKNWLIHKKRKIDLAPKRTWKKYWVCLKGTVLLFFLCDDMGEVSHDAVPRHLLVIEGGIAQAVPEHPKRENIFALSTAYGDAYLFQAPSQIDLDNWICAIHSACASLFARQHGKDNTLKLLKSEINRLEGSIDMDIKMKKMADLQLNVVTDPRSKTAIVKQIAQWDENLEKLYMEQYRLRCYVSSLQGAELPNPKTLLGNVSKQTKQLLNRLGVFTLTAFHAQIGARSPGQSSSKYYRSSRSKKTKPRNGSRGSDASKHPPLLRMDHIDEARPDTSGSGDTSPMADNLARVILPNRQQIIVPITDQMTFAELLETICSKRRLAFKDHFIRLRLSKSDVYAMPKRLDLVKKQNYEAIEICQKTMFQCELSKSETHGDFGLCIEAELTEDPEKGDCLCVFISNIRKGSHAETRVGLMVGDEIVVINGRVIADLDMVYIECLFHELDSVHLTVRSCRTEKPRPAQRPKTPTKYREISYTPPPPPTLVTQVKLAPDSQPTAYKVDDHSDSPSSKSDVNVSSSEQISTLLQNAEFVSDICRKEGVSTATLRPLLTEAQKLRKCVMELIDTERQYVKDLNFLTECYLEPLKQETSLSIEEIEQLFGNIQEIVQFQRQFLQSLEEAIDLQSDFSSLAEPKQFRHILFSLGGSFLYYANHFKLYSSFCASHSKMQKVLNPGEWRKANEVLRLFLSERNPRQQHSATLESYLIKPIQRILKYPLLLQQLKMLTNPDTDEHYHLSEAQRGMETVAEHINEMQKIYEEYGATFLELMKLYREAHPQRPPIDLNIGELQMYGIVEWLNASADLGKIKKGQELLTSCFVFKSGVVLLCKERIKQKKKIKQGSAGSKAPTPEILEFVRFQTLIPVNEVQVRTSAQDTGPVFWWELVHLRLTPDGRQEKIYQLANSTGDARNDFLRTIRQIIRDSVRKMSPPVAMPRLGVCSAFKPYVPPMARPMDTMPKNPRSVAKRRIMQIEGQTERHSLDVPDNYSGLEFEQDFRTSARSNTTGALNNVDLGSSEDQPVDIAASSVSAISTTSSTSQVSTQERPGSARLLFASNNPLTYSSTSIALSDASNSPIWKPRPNVPGKKPAKRGIRAHFADPTHERPSSSHAYGDYTSVLIDKKPTSACSTPRQRSLLESVEDTEC